MSLGLCAWLFILLVSQIRKTPVSTNMQDGSFEIEYYAGTLNLDGNPISLADERG